MTTAKKSPMDIDHPDIQRLSNVQTKKDAFKKLEGVQAVTKETPGIYSSKIPANFPTPDPQCIACSGTGRNSFGGPCVPCANKEANKRRNQQPIIPFEKGKPKALAEAVNGLPRKNMIEELQEVYNLKTETYDTYFLFEKDRKCAYIMPGKGFMIKLYPNGEWSIIREPF